MRFILSFSYKEKSLSQAKCFILKTTLYFYIMRELNIGFAEVYPLFSCIFTLSQTADCNKEIIFKANYPSVSIWTALKHKIGQPFYIRCLLGPSILNLTLYQMIFGTNGSVDNISEMNKNARILLNTWVNPC